MTTAHAQPSTENKSRSLADERLKKESGDATSSTQFADNRPEAAVQRRLKELANNSQQGGQTAQMQAMADNAQAQPIQKKANKTGLPDNLKSGVENLSGYSLDDVKVHYNSSQPAALQAHAYAQGTDIHLAPGQEKHLPHEAWHVVQQKQGRVQPTRQLKGKTNINDDAGLEKEADVMGAKAMQLKTNAPLLQLRSIQGAVVQREFDDTDAVDWTRMELSALWKKLKDKPGTRANCPNYNGAVSTDLEARYVGTDHTERALAEIIIELPAYKAIFRDDRMRPVLPDQNRVDNFGALTDDQVRDQIITNAINHCMYYHATKSEHTAAIFQSGLKASKGGKGEGVSSNGRANMAAESAATYNKWSSGHTFITKDIGEANGYRDSMVAKMQNLVPCEVIRVFSTPLFTRDELVTDIDSNHGLKYKGDMTGIGLNDGTINNTAQTVILSALQELPAINGRVIVYTKADIARVYAAM